MSKHGKKQCGSTEQLICRDLLGKDARTPAAARCRARPSTLMFATANDTQILRPAHAVHPGMPGATQLARQSGRQKPSLRDTTKRLRGPPSELGRNAPIAGVALAWVGSKPCVTMDAAATLRAMLEEEEALVHAGATAAAVGTGASQLAPGMGASVQVRVPGMRSAQGSLDVETILRGHMKTATKTDKGSRAQLAGWMAMAAGVTAPPLLFSLDSQRAGPASAIPALVAAGEAVASHRAAVAGELP
jgi:hypothetical protein